MPSSRRSRHRSRSSHSRSRKPRIDHFANLQKAIYQQLRRWKRRQRRSEAAAAQNLAAVSKAISFRGLWKPLRKLSFRSIRLRTLIKPGSGDPVSTRDALGSVLRYSTTALLLITLISFVFDALPIRIASSQWYLQLLSLVAESIPVLVLAVVFGFLALFIAPSDPAQPRFRRRLLALSRNLYLVFVVLIPIQLGMTSWLLGQAYSSERNQLNAIQSEANALIAGAREQSTPEAFLAYLQSRNLAANSPAVTNAALPTVKASFIDFVRSQRRQNEQRLAASSRQTLLRNLVSASKLFISLVIGCGFFRVSYGMLKLSSLQRTATSAGTPPEASSSL